MLLSHCSQFLFALSAFLCADMHKCGNGEASAAAAAATAMVVGDSAVGRAPVSPLFNAIISRSSGS